MPWTFSSTNTAGSSSSTTLMYSNRVTAREPLRSFRISNLGVIDDFLDSPVHGRDHVRDALLGDPVDHVRPRGRVLLDRQVDVDLARRPGTPRLQPDPRRPLRLRL